jgi:UDP-N-acetylglucosamine--N-acetylmuramyl-(pentapeptide) pyrophosphoryl-undecaprenol N-acetylglucosamine transferase
MNQTSSTPRAPRILFACGGTGGHVYPALAIADAVRALRPDAAIEFAGTTHRMEWQAVPKAGYSIQPITAASLPRRPSLQLLTFPFKLGKGFADAYRLVRGFDADVVVGTGGFVTGPVLGAAQALGRPTLIQEQNAFAGVTNRLLGKRAKEIHIAFPEAAKAFPDGKATMSGNPTRDVLLTGSRSEGRAHYDVPESARMLLMFGGSLGSQRLNEAMLEHAPSLLAADPDLHIVWQTGKLYYERMAEAAPESDRLHVLEYLDEMQHAYAAADVVLCRAGAITCSELAVTQTPAILVPSPNVSEDHQTHNARSLSSSGAARLLPEAELDAKMVGEVTSLLASSDERARMKEALAALARPDAARDIAHRVLALAGAPVQTGGGA